MPSVTQTVKRPGGGLAPDAVVVIELVGEDDARVVGYVSGYEIDGVVRPAVNATTAVWSATLVANSLITPAGTQYKIIRRVDDKTSKQYITVPDGAGPYTVESILVDGPPGALPSAALAAHLADTVDAHAASAVGVADAGGFFGGDDVEEILQELAVEVEFVVTPKQFGAFGNGIADDADAFVDADGSSNADGFVSAGTYRIASDVDLSKHWRFAPGAILRPESGVTVTLDGGFDAGEYQIFDLSSGGTIRIRPGSIRAVNPYWWGAAGDGVADDQAALQAMVTCLERHTGVPGLTIEGAGTFGLASTLEFDGAAFDWNGSGVGNPSSYVNPNDSLPSGGNGTTLKWIGPIGQPMVVVGDCEHAWFNDIYFQGNDAAPPSDLIFFDSTGTSAGSNAQFGANRCRFGAFSWNNDGDAYDYGVRLGGPNHNNDQFAFRDCVFSGATVKGLSIPNSQSVWGQVTNCYFERCTIGLDSAANVICFNLTFNRCSDADIVVSGSNSVQVFGLSAEHSHCLARCTSSGGKLFVNGGMCLVDPALMTDTFFAEHQQCGTSGVMSFENFWLNGVKTLKVRGNNSSSTGQVAVRSCIGLQALSNFDIQAGVGAGLWVRIDSRPLTHLELLTASASLSSTPKFDLGAANFVTTGTVTFGDLTLSGVLTTQKGIVEAVLVNSASGATPTLDATLASVHDLKMTAATVTPTFVAPASGVGAFELYLRQDATGGRNIAWPASVKWNGAAVPTLSTAPNAYDRLVFRTVNGGTTWEADLIGVNYS